MNKKNIVFILLGFVFLVVGLKIFLLKYANQEIDFKKTSDQKNNLKYSNELIFLRNKVLNNQVPDDEKNQAIQAIVQITDKDTAITLLEEIEEKLKNTNIGVELRNRIIKLRFN